MLSIEHARPTPKQVLSHIDKFERYCMGDGYFSPSSFRQINEELSISAVLFIGKRRYRKDGRGKRLIWTGLDQHEYDLGYIHDAQIMRDYPGFSRKSSRSLAANDVKDISVIRTLNGKGSLSQVMLFDGTIGIGPDYRTALRNAVLRVHARRKFNCFSLGMMCSTIWACLAFTLGRGLCFPLVD